MRRLLILAILAALAAGTYVVLPPPARVLPAVEGLDLPPRGAIHVHTRRSDGTGSLEEVATAAARAGLQFVILTDHGDGTRAPERPAYRDGVLCIDAVEISTEGGHVVALGLSRMPYPLGGEARDVLEDVTRLGGFAIAAHPGSLRDELRWTDWSAPFAGIEWSNADSEWRDERPAQLARALLAYPFRKPEALSLVLDRPDAVFRRWDVLTRRRRVVAVAAADAHARLGVRGIGEPYEQRVVLRLPWYEQVFRAFSVALPGVRLTGDAGRDAIAVLDAIRRGRVYSTIDALAGPAAFSFEATSGRHAARGGDVLALDGPVRLRVRAQAPPDARISMVRDGNSLVEGGGASLEYLAPAEPAVYRVEIKLPDAPGQPPVPWIVSNPIYVGRQATEPASTLVRPPAVTSTFLYRNGTAGEWRVEHSSTSSGAVNAVAAVEGQQLLLRYALSGRKADSPFAALVAPAGGAVPAHNRLTFTARADHPMRLSVQLRVPTTSADGERWRRSVYVGTEPREITIFFDDMLPAGRTSTRRPPLERVDAVLFVVDSVNARPGDSGRVWLDDVRYER